MNAEIAPGGIHVARRDLRPIGCAAMTSVSGLVIANGVEYTLEQARDTIAGYCLAMRALEWTPSRHYPSFGAPPSVEYVPRWAFWTYDDIPTSDEDLQSVDLFVAAGLNARLETSHVAAMRALASEAFEALAAIPHSVTFWELPRDDVRWHPEGTPSWYLWRAWWLMSGIPEIKIARVHKFLHHKRPRVVPLIDGRTQPCLEAAGGRGNEWLQIHDDLTSNEEAFTQLEDWFNALPGARLPIFRLRMHDILLWCDRSEDDRAQAEQEGKRVRRILDGQEQGIVVGFPA
jgi:hypothetical protein